jgi:hypothetical protein
MFLWHVSQCHRRHQRVRGEHTAAGRSAVGACAGKRREERFDSGVREFLVVLETKLVLLTL